MTVIIVDQSFMDLSNLLNLFLEKIIRQFQNMSQDKCTQTNSNFFHCLIQLFYFHY